MAEPIWISEQNVVGLMSLPEAITALESGLALQARGEAQNMVKTHVAWGHNNLHAIGAVYPGAGLIGTKTWAHTTGGACPLLVLFDAANGQLQAIIEAFALGQMRTGGISGVATKWLARPEADTLALIGTGKQALAQLAAVAAVRKLREVRVFSPNAQRRAAFIERAAAQFAQLDIAFVDATSIDAAVKDAAIITTVTRATEPFLYARSVAPGTHINAVGAITSERAELAGDVFARCGMAAADDLQAVQNLSSEFRGAFGETGHWDRVRSLSKVIEAGAPRGASVDISLFKAMGMGISDLALGIEILRRARQAGLGTPLPQPQRQAPRLF
jgi:alanine dehydrogenase